IMVITGGKGTLTGPLVGGAIFGILPEVLRAMAIRPEVQWIIYGVLMVLVVYFLPEGIVPAIKRSLAGWKRRTVDALYRQKALDEMSVQPETVLSIEHVAVHFEGLVAIADMTFSVRAGEIVGLIGPNGAGKTTAFNVITGFLKPTSGEVRYRSTPLNGLKPHEIAALGLVRTFQRTSVFRNSSVFENVLTGLHCRGRSNIWQSLLKTQREKEAERQLVNYANEILQFVGLERRASEAAGNLPYGEQRLLGVAMALAVKPSMLLLDEPVSGMNPSETVRFTQLVKKIGATGVTILLVEHDMPMVMQVSDRIVVLNHGRIIAEGPPAEIQNNPEVIRAYLGQ